MSLKGFKTPLAILVVLMLLAGLAYWDEKKTGSDKIANDEKGRLYDFKIADIVSIAVVNTLSQSHPTQWALQKEAGAWKVVSPLVYPADSEGIERFLKILADARFEREFDQSDKDLKSFALDTPPLSYELKDKEGKVYLFAMGGKSPTGYASYLKTTDAKHLYLVNQYLFTATNKTLLDFRNRSLLVPSTEDVQSLEMTWANLPALKVERNGKDWAMLTPLATKADTTEVTKVLSGLSQVRVTEFIDSPVPALRKALTELGKGTQEYVKLNYTTQDGTDKTIVILENGEKLYVKFSDDVFAELDKNQVDALKRSALDLQDRSMFTFVSADVTELFIDATHYQKIDKRWLEGPEKKRADYVQGILVSLEFAKADAKLTVKEGASLTSGPAFKTITIKENAKTLAEFSIWKKPADPASLVLKNGDNYFQVKAEFLDILSPKMPEAAPTLGG